MVRSVKIACLLMLGCPCPMTLADGKGSSPEHFEAAPGAMAECWAESSNRMEVRPCLAAKQKVADAALTEATSRMENKARELDAITTADHDVKQRFLSAQKAFFQYINANCRWHAVMFASGTGAGDTYQACLVDLRRVRTAEIRKALGE